MEKRGLKGEKNKHHDYFPFTYEVHYERVHIESTLVGDVAEEEATIGAIEGVDAETVVSDGVMRVCVPHQEGVVIVGPLVPSYRRVCRVRAVQGQGSVDGELQGGG